jgi:hypothetical protein
MSLKGQLVSLAARKFLASYLKPYAAMLNFSIDPDTKTISLEVLPKGEKESIKVTLSGYEIGEADGKPALRVARTAASREWIDTLLAEFLQGKPVALPPQAAPLLKLLL